MKLLLLLAIVSFLFLTGCPKVVGDLCYGCEPSPHPYEIQLDDPRYYQSIVALGLASHPDSMITTKKAHIDADRKMKKQFKSEIQNLIKSLQEEDSTLVTGCSIDITLLLNSDSIITTDNQIIERRDDGIFQISILKYISAINLLALFDAPCFEGKEEALRKTKTYNDLLWRITKDKEYMSKGRVE